MKQRDFLFLLISVSILAIIWIIFNIIHSVTTSTVNKTVLQQIAPLEPKFNTFVIDKLKERQTIQSSQELPPVSPTIELSPTSTPSLSQTPTPIESSPTPEEPSPTEEPTPTEGAP